MDTLGPKSVNRSVYWCGILKKVHFEKSTVGEIYTAYIFIYSSKIDRAQSPRTNFLTFLTILMSHRKQGFNSLIFFKKGPVSLESNENFTFYV